MPIEPRPGVLPLRTEEDIASKVHHAHEQEFALILLKNPKIEFTYEPVKFIYQNGTRQFHLPDFGIRNLRTGVTTYLELTRAPLAEFEIPRSEIEEHGEIPMGTYEPRGVRINEEGEELVKFASDPKARGRSMVAKVEEELGENIPYYVLYKQQLQRIQDRHPERNLFAEDEIPTRK